MGEWLIAEVSLWDVHIQTWMLFVLAIFQAAPLLVGLISAQMLRWCVSRTVIWTTEARRCGQRSSDS